MPKKNKRICYMMSEFVGALLRTPLQILAQLQKEGESACSIMNWKNFKPDELTGLLGVVFQVLLYILLFLHCLFG